MRIKLFIFFILGFWEIQSFTITSYLNFGTIKTFNLEPATYKEKELQETFLVVDKINSCVTLYGVQSEKIIEINKYRSVTGKNHGDKWSHGDLKTPTGIYFLDYLVDKRLLTKKHGKLALATDYPNAIDKIQGKNGHGIWLHGVETFLRLDLKYDTEGCVVVSNNNILEIANFVEFKKTPIIIYEKIPENFVPKIRNEILENIISKWKEAWSSKNIEKYISFYDKKFTSRGMNVLQWKAYKSNITKLSRLIKVEISKPFVIEHEKYTVAFFFQHYKSDSLETTNIKRLYFSSSSENAKILAEEAL